MEHAYAGPQLPTHINVLRDLDISLCERPQESGLGSQEMGDERSVSCAALLSTPGSERDTHLSGSVLSEQAVPLTPIEGKVCALDEESAVEGEGVVLDVNISALDVRRQDTGAGSVDVELCLLHLLGEGEILGGAVGRDGGERGVGARAGDRGGSSRARCRFLCGL